MDSANADRAMLKELYDCRKMHVEEMHITHFQSMGPIPGELPRHKVRIYLYEEQEVEEYKMILVEVTRKTDGEVTSRRGESHKIPSIETRNERIYYGWFDRKLGKWLYVLLYF